MHRKYAVSYYGSMCGIISYIGDEKTDAVPYLMEGLRKLEYRGHDSAGFAVINPETSCIEVLKTAGAVNVLEKALEDNKDSIPPSHIGIAHTRWAAHGAANTVNSHPHLSKSKTFAIVHNGIIENSADLKKFLALRNFELISDTDSEVIAHLLEYNYSHSITDSIIKTMKMLEGAFAVTVISAHDHNSIYAFRKKSPLLVAKNDKFALIASDTTALLPHGLRILPDG